MVTGPQFLHNEAERAAILRLLQRTAVDLGDSGGDGVDGTASYLLLPDGRRRRARRRGRDGPHGPLGLHAASG